MTTPMFLAPHDQRADLIQVDRALDSMRDAGFDLTAAIGEPLDNSIEAEATLMRVRTVFGRGKKTIDRILIADNGVGIEPTKMHHVLSMGYSSRYGERKGWDVSVSDSNSPGSASVSASTSTADRLAARSSTTATSTYRRSARGSSTTSPPTRFRSGPPRRPS